MINQKLQNLTNQINELIDPYLKKKIKDTGGLVHIGYDDEKKIVIIILNTVKISTPATQELKRSIAKLAKIDFGFKGARIQIDEFKRYDSIINSKTHFLGIVSGKGGVGKSTVTANIAYALSKAGKKVGIIDADIYGSSIPTIMNIPITELSINNDKKIHPLKHRNISLVSTEFFTNPSQPVVWRGGMLTKMLNLFFLDILWPKDLDFMLIDLPPGTGDVVLDIKNLVPQTKFIVITTPNPCASHVAVKAGFAALNIGHSIIGTIENMSYYQNPATNQPDFIFGKGGGLDVANQLGTELIAQIPIGQPLYHRGLFENSEIQGQIYEDLAQLITFTFDNEM